MSETLLEQLNTMTVTVADTGDIHSIEKWKPRDATTNPSLITAAAQMPEYRRHRRRRAALGREEGGRRREQADRRPSPSTGSRSSSACASSASSPAASPPRSTRASRSTPRRRSPRAATSSSSTRRAGAPRERVLIKIASTWEGIRAAEVLQKEGIHCNLTLLFGLHQAVAARRGGGDAHLALRRPHPRLAQEAERPRDGYPAAGGSGRRQRRAHLRLLQEVRLQDRGHGRELPQPGRDRRARRLRPAHHRAQASSPSCTSTTGTLERKLDPAVVGEEGHRQASPSTRPPSAPCTPRIRWPRQARGGHRRLQQGARRAREAARRAAARAPRPGARGRGRAGVLQGLRPRRRRLHHPRGVGRQRRRLPRRSTPTATAASRPKSWRRAWAPRSTSRLKRLRFAGSRAAARWRARGSARCGARSRPARRRCP